MNLSDLQKKTIKAIVSVFETGSVRGRYDALAILNDGAGISYGRHQATLASGNLSRLLLNYYLPHASPMIQKSFDPYIPMLKNNHQALNVDARFKLLLKTVGAEDPVMRRAQDQLFEEQFFVPSIQFCDKIGLTYPLSAAVIYDSMIQGGFSHCRNATRVAIPAKGGNEQMWIHAYLAARENFLRTRPRKIVQETVYRPRTFMSLVRSQNWTLVLPFVVHGVNLTEEEVMDSAS